MATELGAAYISLLPELSQFGPEVRRALGDTGDQAGQAGSQAGDEFGGGFKGAVGKVLSAAAAAGIGAAFVGGLNQALEQGQETAKLGAKLGLNEEGTARAGKIAGELYANNFGGSMTEVNEALGSVMTNMRSMRDATDEDLTHISGLVINTADVFEQDFGGVTKAVSQMLRTGLAKDAEEALDIITKGFQGGADQSEDYLDTLNEYGTQFRKMGIDGTTATGLISQGLKAGARDGDLVADAVKEFSIRAIDGSEATSDAFKLMGMDAKAMSTKIAKGGDGAREGLQQVLDGLRAMEDPMERNAAATGLFGTQSEDLGEALGALDLNRAATQFGEVGGAAQKAADQMGNTPAAQWETFKRQLETGFMQVMTTQVIPALQDTVTWIKENKDTLIILGGAVATAATAYLAYQGYVKLAALWTGRQAIAQGILNAVMAINPIGAVVMAIVALVGVFAIAWAKSEKFRAIVTGAWEGIKAAALGVVEWFRTEVPKAWDAIKRKADQIWSSITRAIGGAWDSIKTKTTAAWDAITGTISSAWNSITGAVQAGVDSVANVLSGMWGAVESIGAAFKGAYDAVVQKIGEIVSYVGGLPGKITGAIGDLGSLLLDSGRALVDGFLAGIKEKWDGLVGWVEGAMSKLRGLWPFSPAKWGPFSGKGYTTYSGQALMRDFGLGILDGAKPATASARKAMELVANEIESLIDHGLRKSPMANIYKHHLISAVQAEYNALKKSGILGKKGAKNVNKVLAGIAASAEKAADKVRRLRDSGRNLSQAFAAGLGDGSAGIGKSLNRLTGDIGKWIEKAYAGDGLEKFRKKHTKNVMWALTGEYNLLKANGRQQDLNTKAIAKATDKLKAMQEMSKGFSDSLRGELDLGALGQSTEPNAFGFGGGPGKITISQISAAVAGLASRAKKFAGKIRALFKSGMPRGLIQEIAGLGSEKGIAVADAILSGSKKERSDLAVNWRTMESATSDAGDALAESWFGIGIDAQKGLIAGLESDGALLDQAAKRLAKRLTKKLKKALGIHSPSRLLAREIGVPSGQGVGVGAIDGLDQMQGAVDRRVAGLMSVPPTPGDDFTFGSALSGADEALVAEFVKALEGMTINNTLALDGRGAARIVQAGRAGLGAYA